MSRASANSRRCIVARSGGFAVPSTTPTIRAWGGRVRATGTAWHRTWLRSWWMTGLRTR
jgi:hypothetical protein